MTITSTAQTSGARTEGLRRQATEATEDPQKPCEKRCRKRLLQLGRLGD
jgi:hypothetical protein